MRAKSASGATIRAFTRSALVSRLLVVLTLREAFNGDDVLALARHRQRQRGQDTMAIDDHSARDVYGMVRNGKNRKTLDLFRWLQLSERQLLTFLPRVRFAMRRPGVRVVVITSLPLDMCARARIYVARNLV